MSIVSVTSVQGRRDYMEDVYVVFTEGAVTIAMVCDGHGGKNAALETCNKLPTILYNNTLSTKGGVQTADVIRRTIIEWGNSLKNYQSGTTLVGFLAKEDTVYFFNVGDSRMFAPLYPGQYIYELNPVFDSQGKYIENNLNLTFKQKSVFSSTDHDFKNKGEVARILAAGGKIIGGRLNGILSLSRALGDKDTGPGLTHIPDISWTRRRAIAGPILMYSDGLYEPERYSSNLQNTFTPEYLYYIASTLNTNVLVNHAYENRSEDNLTALLVAV